MNNDNYLRTPREKIVVGEWTETSNGVPALKIKKPNKDIYESSQTSFLCSCPESALAERKRT